MNESNNGETAEISLWDKIKIKINGKKAGKIAFSTVTSILYLNHCFSNNSPFFESSLAFILTFIMFSIVWIYGC